jgi:hypothetical protein
VETPTSALVGLTTKVKIAAVSRSPT